MRPLRKPYVVLVAGVLLVAIFYGAVEVVRKDWRFGHQAYNTQVPPVNWVRYHAELALAKGWENLFPDRRLGLEQVRLYVPGRAQKALVADVPISTKRWQDAFRLMPDGTLRKTKVRYNGDNPFNWMYGKKSWRVKTRKSELIKGRRTLNYAAPQDILLMSDYIALDVAHRIGVLAARARLVELFVNDESQGVVTETERLDELFLRNAGFMPVNLYKGEQQNLETHERSELDLFNNPGLWSKSAEFNQRPQSDTSDLARVLTLLRRAESSEMDFNLLLEAMPPNVWARFAAYQVLVQSQHNDWIHNQRLVVDPWTGFVHPLAHDTSTLHPLRDGDTPFLDKARQGVFRLMHTNSRFLDAKYRLLFQYLTKDKVLTAVADDIDGLEQALDISVGRDVDLLQYVVEGADRAFTRVEPARQARRALLQSLRQFETEMIARLSAFPQSTWAESEGQFVLALDGEVPLSGLTLHLEEGSPIPNRIFLDIDGDGREGSGDIALPFTVKGQVMWIEATWFANRIAVSNSGDATVNEILQSPTRFRLIGDVPFAITKASAANALTEKREALSRGPAVGSQPARFNRPVFTRRPASPEIWSGEKFVETDRVLRRPVRILAGTTIRMAPGASLVFRAPVTVEGTEEQPVRIQALDPQRPWGAFAIVGRDAAGSKLNHLQLTDGSGDVVDGILMTAMLSVHDTRNIQMAHLDMRQNHDVDDMLHVVYSDHVTITDSILTGARADAVDIDLSHNVRLSGLVIDAPGNDAIDVMGTSVLVEGGVISGAGDKGLSVGEGSSLLAVNLKIHNNAIGVEAKDSSVAQLLHVDMADNATQINAYTKNWRYGGGGEVDVRRSILTGSKAGLSAKKGSKIFVRDSVIMPLALAGNKRIFLSNDNSKTLDLTPKSDGLGDGLLPLYAEMTRPPDQERRGVSP